jgi:hypothetical protein
MKSISLASSRWTQAVGLLLVLGSDFVLRDFVLNLHLSALEVLWLWAYARCGDTFGWTGDLVPKGAEPLAVCLASWDKRCIWPLDRTLADHSISPKFEVHRRDK